MQSHNIQFLRSSMLHLQYHGNVFWVTKACKPVVNTSVGWLSTAQNTCCIYFSVPALFPPYSFPIPKFFSTLPSGAHSLLQKQQNKTKCLQIPEWLTKCLKCLKANPIPYVRTTNSLITETEEPACISPGKTILKKQELWINHQSTKF